MTFSITSMGQISDPGGDPDPDTPEVPIDGGASLLLTASLVYAGKKIHTAVKIKGTQKIDD